jgi:hypothetical protein
MKEKYNQFIGTYTDVCPEGYCQHLINEFERLVQDGAGYNRQNGENAAKHSKNDLSVSLNVRAHSTENFNGKRCNEIFLDGLQKCFNKYTEEFSVLQNGKINATDIKVQRTDPGGGYHIWHSEQGNGAQSDRVLVYMLYLNTLPVESAGETEFLYQRLRIKPQENTMVLWPAAYTHAHRGNTVFGEISKYIVTGWFYYE